MSSGGSTPYSHLGPSPCARSASHLSPPSSRLFHNTFPIIPCIFCRPTILLHPSPAPDKRVQPESAHVIALACTSQHVQPRHVIRLAEPPLAVPILPGISTMAPSPVQHFFDFCMICFLFVLAFLLFSSPVFHPRMCVLY